MKLILAFAVVLLAASVAGQVKHAPMVAQCQADQRLWFSKIEDLDEGHRERLPAFAVLSEWNSEMVDCQRVDPTHAWDYSNTGGEITAEQASRMFNFIMRNEMWKKFLTEDVAGKR